MKEFPLFCLIVDRWNGGMIVAKYTLYLDESTTSNNHNNPVFCMAGVIIKDEDFNNIIIPEMNNLKRAIWHDAPNPTEIIIHQKEVNEGIRSQATDPNFRRFRQNRYCRILYNGLENIFNRNLITIVGTCIVIDNLDLYFNNGIQTDLYLIALQLIMENYCHFLCLNNGVGKILYEARYEHDNEKMRNRYYHIKLMGSMYVNSKKMIEKLGSIDFPKKKDNNIGLQLADFVPNYFARNELGKEQKRFNIDNQLRRYRYDGNLHLRDRFGVKVMP